MVSRPLYSARGRLERRPFESGQISEASFGLESSRRIYGPPCGEWQRPASASLPTTARRSRPSSSNRGSMSYRETSSNAFRSGSLPENRIRSNENKTKSVSASADRISSKPTFQLLGQEKEKLASMSAHRNPLVNIPSLHPSRETTSSFSRQSTHRPPKVPHPGPADPGLKNKPTSTVPSSSYAAILQRKEHDQVARKHRDSSRPQSAFSIQDRPVSVDPCVGGGNKEESEAAHEQAATRTLSSILGQHATPGVGKSRRQPVSQSDQIPHLLPASPLQGPADRLVSHPSIASSSSSTSFTALPSKAAIPPEIRMRPLYVPREGGEMSARSFASSTTARSLQSSRPTTLASPSPKTATTATGVVHRSSAISQVSKQVRPLVAGDVRPSTQPQEPIAAMRPSVAPVVGHTLSATEMNALLNQ
jgi:hypothetical protein